MTGLIILIVFTVAVLWAAKDTWRLASRDVMDEEWLSESDDRRSWRAP